MSYMSLVAYSQRANPQYLCGRMTQEQYGSIVAGDYAGSNKLLLDIELLDVLIKYKLLKLYSSKHAQKMLDNRKKVTG